MPSQLSKPQTAALLLAILQLQEGRGEVQGTQHRWLGAGTVSSPRTWLGAHPVSAHCLLARLRGGGALRGWMCPASVLASFNL